MGRRREAGRKEGRKTERKGGGDRSALFKTNTQQRVGETLPSGMGCLRTMATCTQGHGGGQTFVKSCQAGRDPGTPPGPQPNRGKLREGTSGSRIPLSSLCLPFPLSLCRPTGFLSARNMMLGNARVCIYLGLQYRHIYREREKVRRGWGGGVKNKEGQGILYSNRGHSFLRSQTIFVVAESDLLPRS